MTRIIAGSAGSLTLAVPRSGTRPTSDRVREAIFSALEARDAIEGATVLDLYAGSGALGLEAASRGAAEVVLVEKAKSAADVCRRNADAVTRATRSAGTGARIRVAMRSVGSYLEGAAPGFDLVFVDPPYDFYVDRAADMRRLLETLVARVLRDAEARVISEHRLREGLGEIAGGKIVDERHYGDTVVTFYARA